MRKEFMKRIDARKSDIDDKKGESDIASNPFGAEEMLLNTELKNLEKDSLTK